ncbi:hypothetical protein STRDD11_01160 [Streptococcus sp. DD11]|nr:hypothetical protein STRDD11_01160 [Streptococcus sp. DD11]
MVSSAFFFTCSVDQMGFFVKQHQLAAGIGLSMPSLKLTL